MLAVMVCMHPAMWCDLWMMHSRVIMSIDIRTYSWRQEWWAGCAHAVAEAKAKAASSLNALVCILVQCCRSLHARIMILEEMTANAEHALQGFFAFWVAQGTVRGEERVEMREVRSMQIVGGLQG